MADLGGGCSEYLGIRRVVTFAGLAALSGISERQQIESAYLLRKRRSRFHVLEEGADPDGILSSSYYSKKSVNVFLGESLHMPKEESHSHHYYASA